MCAFLQTKTGNVHLLPSKRSKVLVQAVLKQDILQIFEHDIVKTLNIKIEHVSHSMEFVLLTDSIS